MQSWQIALEKFLDKYKKEDFFLGAILTGSYATGNYDENSDIDVYIITSDEVKWRERGNKNVDGFLIEYFINPKWKILDYMNNELKTYHLSTTMIFVNAHILYDKDGAVAELVRYAKENATLTSLAPIDNFKYKTKCYSVWDAFDELEAKYRKNSDIEFSYYIFLQKVIDAYFYNRQIPSIPLNKIERIFCDDEYRLKYNVKKMPDDEFVDMIKNCFEEKKYDDRFRCAKSLYEYFLHQFSDFDINNLEIRSIAE